MSTRKESERVKLMQEKCQTLLTQMLRDEDNKYCVDCDAKGPRWASWNLGVFLCIRCAGIHRNLGVHISRVKSVNLDSWTPEQVVSLQQMGNSRARAVYEAQLPDGFRRPQTDSALESFIRAKYEHKKYLAREWVPPPPPKVDWAKEIDEEIEKQKRKKKSNSSCIVGGSLVVGSDGLSRKSTATTTTTKTPIPAPLPKPKSSNSPKVNRISLEQNSHHQHHNNSSNNQTNSDLLGLSSPVNSCESLSQSRKSNNESDADGFSNFLSAAPISSSTVGNNHNKVNLNNDSGLNSLAKEEEDFFKQSSGAGGTLTDKDKGKLTKDSILALYGTPPPPNNSTIGQFNNNSLVGFNSTFSHHHHQPGAGAIGGGIGQFMPIPVPSQTQQQQQQQTFSGIHPHIAAASSLPAGIPSPSATSVLNLNTQFGQHTGTLANNLNMNLAGMPPGLLGPPQPQPHATQFMSTPSSVTSMYNAPVMTAPGAFTSAMLQQQMLPQPTFAAQFPPQQALGGGVAGTMSTASGGFGGFGGIGPTAVPGGVFNATQFHHGIGAGGGGNGVGSMMSALGPVAVQIPNAATATHQPTPSNLSQQFGNLNLGNVWQ